MARAMVDGGSAEIASANGRVKSIKLIESALSHAWMIGPPTGARTASRFCVRDRLDNGAVVWRHHPRATEYE